MALFLLFTSLRAMRQAHARLAERLRERLLRSSARLVDQARTKAFWIVEQNLEDMLGGELLIAFPQGQRLGGLNESAGTVGELLEIHVLTPSAHDGTGNMAGPMSAARLGHYVGAIIAL